MTLRQIIDIADAAYHNGLIRKYDLEPDGEHGDSLAGFIARELKETYDEDATDAQQLDAAYVALNTAVCELQDVVDAFEGRALCCTR
jgi:hypothetical protein